MKTFTLLLCAALLGAAIPVQTAHADVAVSIDYFYDALQPHGDWVYIDGYGYCWQPAVALSTANWSPYTDGHWAYSTAGWTWVSYEDFGWATYHYGRWVLIGGGWFWVPGYEWAPAWVSWRQTDTHVGWAPLPPEARWSRRIGFSGWIDSYYDIGPGYYNFLPLQFLVRRSSLRPFIIDRSRNVTFIDRSVNITNITYQQNVVNNIFVGGPDLARVERFGGSEVRRLQLRRDDDAFQRDLRKSRDGRWEGPGRSRIEGDELVVTSPTIRQDESPRLPERVRERIERPQVDRGWRNVESSEVAERIREKQRAEMEKAKPKELPEKEPQVVTSTVPPPAFGRTLRDNERMGATERPDPRKVEQEVRKAIPGAPPARSPSEEAVTQRPDTKPGVADTPPARPGADPRQQVGRPELPPDQRPTGVAEETGPRPRLMPPGRATVEAEAARKSDPDKGSAARKSEDAPPAAESAPKATPEKSVPSKKATPETEVRPAGPPGRFIVPPGLRPPPKAGETTPEARPVVPERARPSLPQARPEPTPRPSLPQARPESTPRPSLPQARPEPAPRPSLPQARPESTPRPSLPRARPESTPRPSLPRARPDLTPRPPLPKALPKATPPSVPPKAKERSEKSKTPALSQARPSPSLRASAPQVQSSPRPVPQVRSKPAPSTPKVRSIPPKPTPKVSSPPAPRRSVPQVRAAPPRSAPPQVQRPAPKRPASARPSASKAEQAKKRSFGKG